MPRGRMFKDLKKKFGSRAKKKRRGTSIVGKGGGDLDACPQETVELAG